MHRHTLNRRAFIALATGTAATAALGEPAAADPTPKIEGDTAWYNVAAWGVEGKGWDSVARYYDRFPEKAQATVPASVWNLSRHSAGMMTRFETDAASIQVRYTLLSANLAMPHMPATGVSGMDLYARDNKGNNRWLGVARPTAQQVVASLASGIDAGVSRAHRLCSLYLPLYNGVESLEIGVPAGAGFRPVAPRRERSIVFYGTSIMHGACASRPGMSISAILGRRFDRPTINLGFSGSGKMEASVGALLAELDPSVYAIDCLPNMNGELVAERAAPLVRQLRAARPRTPILLVEDRTLTNAEFYPSSQKHHQANRAALRKAFETLKAEGVDHLYYLKGEDLLGDDGEAATDGSHPSDLGMVRYADAYEKVLRKLL